MIRIGQGTTGTKIMDSEKLVWDMDVMQCGHRVERSEFYIDDDSIIRMRYVCEEGCRTPWIKLRKVQLPHEISFTSDPFEDNYVPRTYIWKRIYKGDILPFKCEDGKVEDYEVAYKLRVQRNLSGKPKKILYLRPICNEEYVLAEFWEDGSIHFMPGIEEPLTTRGFQSWTEEILEKIERRVMYFKMRRKG